MSTVNKYRLFCETENDHIYTHGQVIPKQCPNDKNHTINEETIIKINSSNLNGIFDHLGHLQVKSSELTMFGDTRVTEYTPIIQNYSLYGVLNDQMYTSFTFNNGTITPSSDGTETTLNISNDLYSYSVLRSKKVLKYRPGYSNICRFNAVFDTGITNCLQFSGLGNNGSDIYFCYNGMDFGIRVSTGGKSDVHILTLTEGEGSSNSTADIVLNGVTYNVPLTDTTTKNGDTIDVNFTAHELATYSYSGWNTEVIGNTVIFQAKDVGVKNGTFSFSCNGDTTGSFSQEMIGQALSTTFVSRDEWNGFSEMITNINPQMRNMYAIEYSWYGSGNILFKVYNPDSARYELVHQMKFANTQTTPSLSAPNMFIQSGVASLGSTTTKTIKIAGSFAATDGKINIKTPIYGIVSTKSIPKDTERVLMALKNRNTVNGFSNQSEMLITRFSFTTNGTKPVKLQIIKNPSTLSSSSINDYSSWMYVDKNNSISLYDTSSQTYTGGEILDTFQLPKEDALFIDLNNRELFLYQRDIILFVVESSGISEVDVAVTILEDL